MHLEMTDRVFFTVLSKLWYVPQIDQQKLQNGRQNSTLRQSKRVVATIFEGLATIKSVVSDNKTRTSDNCKTRPKTCRRPPSLSISVKNPSTPNIPIRNGSSQCPITAPFQIHPLQTARSHPSATSIRQISQVPNREAIPTKLHVGYFLATEVLIHRKDTL